MKRETVGPYETVQLRSTDPNALNNWLTTNGFAIGENPVEGLQTLGDLTRIVHLSDAPSGQWRHDAIGSGDIDFAAILAHLDTIGFREPIVLEILADDPMAGLVDGSARLQDLPS